MKTRGDRPGERSVDDGRQRNIHQEMLKGMKRAAWGLPALAQFLPPQDEWTRYRDVKAPDPEVALQTAPRSGSSAERRRTRDRVGISSRSEYLELTVPTGTEFTPPTGGAYVFAYVIGGRLFLQKKRSLSYEVEEGTMSTSTASFCGDGDLVLFARKRWFTRSSGRFLLMAGAIWEPIAWYAIVMNTQESCDRLREYERGTSSSTKG